MAVYIRNAYAVQAIQVTPDNREETSAFTRGYRLFSYSPGDWLVNAAGMPTQVYSDAEFKARFSAPYVAIAAPRIDSLPGLVEVPTGAKPPPVYLPIPARQHADAEALQAFRKSSSCTGNLTVDAAAVYHAGGNLDHAVGLLWLWRWGPRA